MGLDQYAFTRRFSDLPQVSQEIAYWRKHNRLQGWMEQLYTEKGGEGSFNCQDLYLTKEDIDNLQRAIENRNLPKTGGFFFGDDSYENEDPDNSHTNYPYYEEDLNFISTARQALRDGKLVWYHCWW